jgi:hypothetical protein
MAVLGLLPFWEEGLPAIVSTAPALFVHCGRKARTELSDATETVGESIA